MIRQERNRSVLKKKKNTTKPKTKTEDRKDSACLEWRRHRAERVVALHRRADRLESDHLPFPFSKQSRSDLTTTTQIAKSETSNAHRREILVECECVQRLVRQQRFGERTATTTHDEDGA